MASNTAPRKAQSKANKPASGKKDAGIAVPVKRRTDWEAVERDYRIDKFTLRELAKKHDANHATIARRAEREGWTKDLTGAIRQATNARVISETVQQKCDTAQQNATDTAQTRQPAGNHWQLLPHGRVRDLALLLTFCAPSLTLRRHERPSTVSLAFCEPALASRARRGTVTCL